MAKKLKETYRHTHRQTDRLPLVVLSAAVAAKNTILLTTLPASTGKEGQCLNLGTYIGW